MSEKLFGEFSVRKLALNENNNWDALVLFADGEGNMLTGDAEYLSGAYEALKNYFEQGIVDDEVAEIEESEGYKLTWQAVMMARLTGAPENRTDDQIANTIRNAARNGLIPGVHQSHDGRDWWYPRQALERYLATVRWREPKPTPVEIAQAPESKPVIVKPADRKAANAILKQYGYRWEKFDREWLEDNDDFNREPGWYLFHGTGKATRELGRGDMAVDQAFDEINRGVDVVLAEKKEAARIERQRQHEAEERQRAITAIEKQIIKHGECPKECTYPDGETLFDTGNIYGTGECFVIAPDYIWYIRNNGMDGDDWSRNNLPGAIAWRIPYDESVASKLKGLA